MKINRKRLIEFYDVKSTEDGYGADVSAVTGIMGEELLLALVQDYWKTEENAGSQILEQKCNTGKRKGPRLDAWILKKGKTYSLFQTEVKNWAAHSLGGKELAINAEKDILKQYGQEYWNYYFGKERISSKKVGKVMCKMKKPKDEKIRGLKPIPLLCFWFFITDKNEKPYSIRKYKKGNTVHVFSASAYLRSIKTEFIELNLPRAEKRLKLIRDLSAELTAA